MLIVAEAGADVDRNPVWCRAVSNRSLGVFMLRTLSLTVTAVALAATACTANSGPAPSTGSSGAPAAADKTSLTFGDTFRGMVDTTVSQPRPMNPSPSAFPNADQAWGVDVTFTNNAPQTLSPSMFRMGATTDGRASTSVVDPQSGLLGLETAPPIAPGETVTLPMAFVGDVQGRNTITVSSMDGSQTVVFR